MSSTEHTEPRPPAAPSRVSAEDEAIRRRPRHATAACAGETPREIIAQAADANLDPERCERAARDLRA